MRRTNVSDVRDGMGPCGGASLTASGKHISLSPDALARLMRGEGPIPEDMVLPRATGSVATLARFRGRVLAARCRGGTDAERDACWKLATHHSQAEHNWTEALVWARRALELGGEDAFRVQVCTWLERVGLHREAAVVLAPCVTAAPEAREAARLLVRMARLQVRAGEIQLAMENLLEAATVRGFGHPKRTSSATGHNHADSRQNARRPVGSIQSQDARKRTQQGIQGNMGGTPT